MLCLTIVKRIFIYTPKAIWKPTPVSFFLVNISWHVTLVQINTANLHLDIFFGWQHRTGNPEHGNTG